MNFEFALETFRKFAFEGLVLFATPFQPGFLPTYKPIVRDQGDHLDGASIRVPLRKIRIFGRGERNVKRTKGSGGISFDPFGVGVVIRGRMYPQVSARKAELGRRFLEADVKAEMCCRRRDTT